MRSGYKAAEIYRTRKKSQRKMQRGSIGIVVFIGSHKPLLILTLKHQHEYRVTEIKTISSRESLHSAVPATCLSKQWPLLLYNDILGIRMFRVVVARAQTHSNEAVKKLGRLRCVVSDFSCAFRRCHWSSQMVSYT